jgi:hypothetical protein
MRMFRQLKLLTKTTARNPLGIGEEIAKYKYLICNGYNAIPAGEGIERYECNI